MDENKRGSWRILRGKPLKKGPLGRPKGRLEEDIKMHREEKGCSMKREWDSEFCLMAGFGIKGAESSSSDTRELVIPFLKVVR